MTSARHRGHVLLVYTHTHRQTDIITCSTSFNIIALLYYILQHIQIIKLSEENSAAGYIVKRDVLSESSV